MHQPRPFTVHPLWRHAHAQTFAGEFLPRRFGPRFAEWRASRSEHLFVLPDGDRLLAHVHLQPDDPDRRKPVILHLHGLEGHARSHYQEGLSAKAFAAGFHSIRLNYRNCGDTEHLAKGFYFGSVPDDVVEVLAQLHKEWGFGRIFATGVSLGANLLLRLLADAGKGPPPGLEGAVSISAPIDMSMTGDALGRGLNRCYGNYFLMLLKRKLRRKVRFSPNGKALAPIIAKLRGIRTLRQFDETITAPLGGFADATAYYARGSSGDDLGAIRLPTLLIHAQDDPFLPFEMYRSREAIIAANPFLMPFFPLNGGHVGFVEPPGLPHDEPWMDQRWSENEAVRFLARLSEQPAAAGQPTV